MLRGMGMSELVPTALDIGACKANAFLSLQISFGYELGNEIPYLEESATRRVAFP